jgi:glycerate kinase
VNRRDSPPVALGHIRDAVLVAPDKFKGCMSATEVAHALARGLDHAAPATSVDVCPVADGGDGLLDALIGAGFRSVPVSATGPTGQPVESAFVEKDGVAVVELADVAGLQRLPGGRPAPLTASSAGTGQVMRAALDAGCDTLVVGVGGSASTDGGAGMLAGLGARLLDESGQELPAGGAALLDVHRVDLTQLHPRLAEVALVVACDVDNPLLGPSGAAAVYGPQKGANDADIELLERALSRWADVLGAATGTQVASEPGAGAAGGVAFAAMCLGARTRPGIELVLELAQFDRRLERARLVITGEGSLDTQTLRGKAPAGVAAAAARQGVPVIAVAGRKLLDADELRTAGFLAVHALTDLEPDVQRCIEIAPALLEQVSARIAADLGAVSETRP